MKGEEVIEEINKPRYARTKHKSKTTFVAKYEHCRDKYE